MKSCLFQTDDGQQITFHKDWVLWNYMGECFAISLNTFLEIIGRESARRKATKSTP